MMYRLSIGLFALAFWLIVPSSQAQTPHPCDVTPAAGTLRPTTLFGAGFCHSLKDRAGNKTPETVPKSARVLIDDVERYNGAIEPQGAPNAFGLTYFETPRTLTLPAGTHVMKIFVTNSIVPGESDALTFTIVVAQALTRADTPTRGRIVPQVP